MSTPWSWSIYTTGRRYCPSLRPRVAAWSNYLSWSEPRPPCVHRQFGVLLLATTASTSSSITRRRIRNHTGSHLCSSKVDYWNLLLAGAPVCYRQVAAARRSTTAASHLLYSEQRWLYVADRNTYKLGLTVDKCLHDHAQDYLSELRTSVAQVAERQHLRSASRHLLVDPWFQLDTYGHRTFTVAGPSTGNLSQKQFAWAGNANWLFSSYTEDVSFWTVLSTLSALEALF